MFKKISVTFAILALALFTAAAATVKTPKESFGFQGGAFVESNVIANSVGAEVEGYYMPWDNWGFAAGVRGFGYFAFNDETGITPVRPMIMPYVAVKYNNFEFGGGAGFNLGEAGGPQVTPYARLNWDIPFTKAVEGKNSRFSMTVGCHWYIVMPIVENTEAGNLGEGIGVALLAMLEAISNVIPKVNVGFTYQFDNHAVRAN